MKVNLWRGFLLLFELSFRLCYTVCIAGWHERNGAGKKVQISMGKREKTLTAGGVVLLFICAILTQVLHPCFSNAKKKIELSGNCGENATWQYDQKTRTMTVRGNGEVTAGGWQDEKWFDDDYDYFMESDNLIQTLIIEEGITAIGKAAFSAGCMSEVRLPETLTEIGTSAFSECVGI